MKNLTQDEKMVLAQSSLTSSKTLAMLANEKDEVIRQLVAWNENTPVLVLIGFLQDEAKFVREIAEKILGVDDGMKAA